MTWQIAITLATTGLLVLALARNWASPDLLLLAALTFLLACGVVNPREAIAGFGNEGPITVAILFVITAGLTETGAMALVSRPLLGRPRSVKEAQARMMLPVMSISAFLNNTPVVAMFMPVIQDWCKKANLSASKLFIPLSYASILGGVCTLIGTSTNIVVNGLLIDAAKTDPSLQPFGMFTLAWIGIPVMVLGFIYMMTLGSWLLIDRRPKAIDAEDPRQYTVEMMVEPGSGIEGATIEKAGLRHLPGLYLVEIERQNETLVAVGPEQILRGGDRLIFVGLIDSVVDLQKIRGLVPATSQVGKVSAPRPERGLVEAVLSAQSPLVGLTVRAGRFRSVYDAAIIAVHRQGERIRQKIGDIILEPGDTLLVEAHPGFVEKNRHNRDFLLVSAIADSHPMRHDRARPAFIILAAMVAAVGMEWMSMLTGGLIAGAAMLIFRCCSVEQARRSIDWPILVAIGAALGLGKAIEMSGTAQYVADGIITICKPYGTWAILAGIYLVTLLFTEFLTNNAAAVLVFPIAKATAVGLGVSVMPFAVAIAVAASCGFAMPLGYQTHLMVFGAGGYRTSDFLRVGVPLDIITMAAAVALIPVFFPF